MRLGGRVAPSRVVFGPHVTNLGVGRALGPGHAAYYGRRAAGGAGVIVTETASVHPSDWPYERAPLASHCGPGWAAIAQACPPAVVLAGLGHTGNQGSSAWSQQVLWGASRVADVVTREQPMAIGAVEVGALVEGYAAGASSAVGAGLAGVEVDAGDRSLLRQLISPITGGPGAVGWGGQDGVAVLTRVLAAVRAAVAPAGGVVGLRLSVDEQAGTAGITPAAALRVVDAVADLVDLLVVVRAGPYRASGYRPDAHEAPGFNRAACAAVRRVAAGRAAVVLQGSVVDSVVAEGAIADGVADLVEMTRAQIADADLVAAVRAGRAPRPCVRCNQACQVLDVRNPAVSCIGDPASGWELTEPSLMVAPPRRALVVGGGPAGMECARVLAGGGWAVRLVERDARLGGVAALAPGRAGLADLLGWLAARCRESGVQVVLGSAVQVTEVRRAQADGVEVVLATGSVAGEPPVPGAVDVVTAMRAGIPSGRVVVWDPVGSLAGVATAEWLADRGRAVAIATPDPVAGVRLDRTGDLADANARLQRLGVARELRCRPTALASGRLTLVDVVTGTPREVACDVLVDCGHRLPDRSLAEAVPLVEVRRPTAPGAEPVDTPEAALHLVGDAVAPRTILEAVLEGRRAARDLLAAPAAVPA